VNRAFTTLSYGGTKIALFGDGQDHPGLGVTRDGKEDGSDCISNPNSKRLMNLVRGVWFTQSYEVHTQNETMAAGTVFAISYVSDLKKVTQENLVVFTVLPKYIFIFLGTSILFFSLYLTYSTPWKRLATYQVPNLPACPADGCICAVRSRFLYV
jgi:hypothetical protein